MTDTAAPSTRLYGAQSMTAPLHDVVVKRPGAAFGAAYDNPAHGFLHPVDLAEAQRQHDAFCQVVADLGVRVHQLDAETESPDLTYSLTRRWSPTGA
jgi:arginine deiminase